MNGEPEHGTRQRYQRRCRCADCTRANTLYQRDYRKSWVVVRHPDRGVLVYRQPSLPLGGF